MAPGCSGVAGVDAVVSVVSVVVVSPGCIVGADDDVVSEAAAVVSKLLVCLATAVVAWMVAAFVVPLASTIGHSMSKQRTRP